LRRRPIPERRRDSFASTENFCGLVTTVYLQGRYREGTGKVQGRYYVVQGRYREGTGKVQGLVTTVYLRAAGLQLQWMIWSGRSGWN
jgi:hypothetical protein